MCQPEKFEPQGVGRTQAIESSIAAHVAPVGQAEAETAFAAVLLSTGAHLAVAPSVCKAGAGYTPVASTLAVPYWHRNAGWRID